MSHQVEVNTVPAQTIAVIRRQARQSELAKVVPDCCGQVWNFLRAHNPWCSGAPLLPQAHLIHIAPLPVCDLRLGFYDADEGMGEIARNDTSVLPCARSVR